MTSKAEQDVLADRQRQIDVEGWTLEHDDEHINGELEDAAMAYMVHRRGAMPCIWPWSKKWWKPKSRRMDLVRAAALRLAEVHRLKRVIEDAEDMYSVAIGFIERIDRKEN